MVRISVFIFLLFSSYSAIGFFFPLHLQSKGLDAAQIGSVLAFGAMISILAQPTWGFISDRTKSVKWVLVFIMFGALFVSFGLFGASSMLMIVLCFIGLSFFNTATAPLTDTLCISYAHEHNKDYGRLRLWGEVGVGTAALALGFIVQSSGIGFLGSLYAGMLCSAIAASFFLKDSKMTPLPVNLPMLGRLFRNPKLLWFLFLILLVAIPHRMNDSMLTLYLDRLQASESQLGWAWTVGTFSTVPALIIVGRLIERWGAMRIFIMGALLYSLRWAVYSLADSPMMLVIFQALHGLTFPFFMVASIHYLAALVPSELRATGQAALAVTFGGLGGIIGNAAGGQLMNQLGPGLAYGAGFVLALVGAMAAIVTYQVSKRGRPQESGAE